MSYGDPRFECFCNQDTCSHCGTDAALFGECLNLRCLRIRYADANSESIRHTVIPASSAFSTSLRITEDAEQFFFSAISTINRAVFSVKRVLIPMLQGSFPIGGLLRPKSGEMSLSVLIPVGVIL